MGSGTIAYEYQTFGGQEYIQFLYQVGVSAGVGFVGASATPTGYLVFPFNGNVAQAFQQFSGFMQKIAQKLGGALSGLGPSSTFHQLPCNPKTITVG